jgi:hypothetical protein
MHPVQVVNIIIGMIPDDFRKSLGGLMESRPCPKCSFATRKGGGCRTGKKFTTENNKTKH